MMMEEKIVTTVIDTDMLILSAALLWSVKRRGEPEQEEGCKRRPKGCGVRAQKGRADSGGDPPGSRGVEAGQQRPERHLPAQHGERTLEPGWGCAAALELGWPAWQPPATGGSGALETGLV